MFLRAIKPIPFVLIIGWLFLRNADLRLPAIRRTH